MLFELARAVFLLLEWLLVSVMIWRVADHADILEVRRVLNKTTIVGEAR